MRDFDDFSGLLLDHEVAPETVTIEQLLTAIHYSNPELQLEQLTGLADSLSQNPLEIMAVFKKFQAELVARQAAAEKNRLPSRPIPVKRENQQAATQPTETAQPTAPTQHPPLATMNATDLMKQEFKPLRWIAENVQPEGLGILTARPKTGKSWLALDLAVAVATGQKALDHFQVDQGRVLYLGLEDSPRRLQDRIRQIVGEKKVNLNQLEISCEIPPSIDGGLVLLEGWLGKNRDARLVVIDTLGRFRRIPGRPASLYQSDTEFLSPIQRMAQDAQVAVLLVHHQRKALGIDPLDSISGTLGLPGVADSLSILSREHRGRADAMLYITGRDFADNELGLTFCTDDGGSPWTYAGTGEDVRRSRERQEILDLLGETVEPMRSGEIAKALGKGQTAISMLLKKLANEGRIQSVRYGLYSLKMK